MDSTFKNSNKGSENMDKNRSEGKGWGISGDLWFGTSSTGFSISEQESNKSKILFMKIYIDGLFLDHGINRFLKKRLKFFKEDYSVYNFDF